MVRVVITDNFTLILPIWWFLILVFVIFFLGIFIFLLIQQNKDQKALKKQDIDLTNIPYFRDIPFEAIDVAFWVGVYYGLITNISDFIGAMLLKWIKEGHIDILQNEYGETVINMQKIFQTDAGIESNIYIKLLACAGTNRLLEEREFQNFFQRGEATLMKLFQQMNKEVEEKLLKQGLLVSKENENGKVVLVPTTQLEEKAKQLCGLKKFLQDFSHIETRESLQVHLWEDYLIYAQMFGMAQVVEEEMKHIYPDYQKTVRLNIAKVSMVNSAILSLHLTARLLLAMTIGSVSSDN